MGLGPSPSSPTDSSDGGTPSISPQLPPLRFPGALHAHPDGDTYQYGLLSSQWSPSPSILGRAQFAGPAPSHDQPPTFFQQLPDSYPNSFAPPGLHLPPAAGQHRSPTNFRQPLQNDHEPERPNVNILTTSTFFPSISHPPHMFECEISFIVYCPVKSKSKKKMVWKALRSKVPMSILFDCHTIDLETFKDKVSRECGGPYRKMPPLIEECTNAAPPTMLWVGHMGRNPNWLKSGSQSVAGRPMFVAWMDAILKSGAKKGGVFLKMSNPTDEVELAASNDLMAVTARRIEARAATRAASQNTGLVGTLPAPSGSEAHSAVNNADPGPFDLVDSGDDSCDEGFEAIKIIQEDIFKKYNGNTDVDPRMTVFPHPTDVNQYIILSSGNVAIWARAIHGKESGVTMECPPARLKYYTRKGSRPAEDPPAPQTPHTPSQPAQMTPETVVAMIDLYQQRGTKRAHSPGVDASPVGVSSSDDDLRDYLAFLGLPDDDGTLELLKQSGVDHYEMFGEGYLSAEELQGLGLKVGILAKLRRNVGRYKRSLDVNRE